MRKTKNTILLLLTALIWGSAFVAQSVGMDYVGPFTFNSVRCLIGGLVLLPCIFFFKRFGIGDGGWEEEKSVKGRRDLITGGILCGVFLACASSAQQVGLTYTTVGKAGFITAMYIVIVPVLGIFLKRLPKPAVWVSVVLAVAGLYLLCMTDSFALSPGDAWVLASALLFAFHIMVIDYFSPKADGVKLSCIQFFVAGIVCGVPMLLFEKPQILEILQAWQPILYAGVLSCGVAYTLQIIAQKDYDPTAASLILSLESVFSVLAGWVILGEELSPRELAGCALMFAAIILVVTANGRSK
ncbi:MAG TPA: DMT family transporter [Candidatus Limivivens intestinipullorum]|uniref:DMT family transporter n=1 Tax=Candidatus Limivivens intestinipullorum TaxID=2840858 RepID=A0A9D1ERX6_9FIRM|nr:DMT family transporter [Candidatus Limivivens intestinipullorum]